MCVCAFFREREREFWRDRDSSKRVEIKYRKIGMETELLSSSWSV